MEHVQNKALVSQMRFSANVFWRKIWIFTLKSLTYIVSASYALSKSYGHLGNVKISFSLNSFSFYLRQSEICIFKKLHFRE